jgi:hypothetical protein
MKRLHKPTKGLTVPRNPTGNPPGRPPIYPWAAWLDGRDHVLVAGRDFDADKDLQKMRTQILNAAKRKGVVIRTTVEVSEAGSVIRVASVG